MKQKLLLLSILWLTSLLLAPWQQGSLFTLLSFVCLCVGLLLIVSLWQSNDEINVWQELANRDELTHLLNRRGLFSATLKAPYALVLLDINHFKITNDTHGHTIGDEVLKHLADNLRKSTRQEDICVRWGGDEFVILLANADKQSANFFINRLRNQLEKESFSPAYQFAVGCADSQDSTQIAELIKVADTELRHNKANR